MQPTAHAGGRTVLIVDDDPDVRAVLTDAFESEGFRVMTAANGVQALHRTRDAPPDVIVLDLNMPMMKWRRLPVRLARRGRDHSVPIVAISAAYPSLQPEDLAGDAFFPKPFDVDLLIRHVKDLLACRPRSSVADHGKQEAEVNATLRDLSKVMSAIVGGVEALANDPSMPPKLHTVATSTLGSTQRAGILVRRLQHLAANERRRS